MLVGLTTHADGSPVCSSVVCLFLLSRTDAARITTLDVEMFHYESRKPVYFEDRKLRANVTSHINSAGVDLSTLVSAGFFCFSVCAVCLCYTAWNTVVAAVVMATVAATFAATTATTATLIVEATLASCIGGDCGYSLEVCKGWYSHDRPGRARPVQCSI